MKKYFIIAVFFGAISLYLSFINLGFEYEYAGGDAGAVCIFPLKALCQSFFSWYEMCNAGMDGRINLPRLFPFLTVISGLNFIGLSTSIIQRLLFSLYIFIPALFMFYLLSYLLKEDFSGRLLILSLSSLFYALNHFTMIILSHPVGLGELFVFYLVLPLLFLVFIKGLKGEAVIKHALLFGLLFMISLPGNMAYTGLVVLLLGSYFLWCLVMQRNYKQMLKFICYAIGFSILFSFWFIIPFGNFILSNKESLSQSSWLGDVGYLRLLNKRNSLGNVLALSGEVWDNPQDIASLKPLHDSLLYIRLKYVIPLLSFSALFWYKRKKELTFFSLLAITMLFLAKGINPPFGGVFLYLYNHIPGFSIYRNAYDKFSMLIAFSYTVLIAVSLSCLVRHISKGIIRGGLYMVVSAAIIVSGGLFWQGRVVRWPNFLVKVPNSYYAAQQWVNSQKEDSKVLTFPMVSRRMKKLNWGYMGVDLFELLFNKPVLNYYDLSQKMGGVNDWLLKKEHFPIISKIFNISYLLLDSNHTELIAEKGNFQVEKTIKIYQDIFENRLSQFLSKEGIFNGLRFYKVKEDFYLPHIYVSFSPAVIIGDYSILEHLCFERYLGKKPVLLFTEQERNLKIKVLNQINSFVFKDNSWQDLAIQFAEDGKWEMGNPEGQAYGAGGKWEKEFRIRKEGIYEVYLDVSKIGKWGMGNGNWEMRVDGDLVYIPRSIVHSQKRGRKYVKIGEEELEEGEHVIKIKNQNAKIKMTKQNSKLILVNKEKREEAEKLIWKKINQPGTKLCYIFRKDGKFYLPREGDYIVKAKILPHLVRKKEIGPEFKLGMEEEFKNWSMHSSRVSYDYSVTENGIFVLSSYFDGDEREDEFLQMRHKGLKIDLEKYPYFDLTYRIEDPEVQIIEVVAGIDFDRDGKVNEYIRGIYQRPASIVWTDFSYNLYGKAKKVFPDEEYYELIHLELYPHKLWRVDCSEPNERGEYKFWIKGLQFYSYSSEDFFEVIEDVLDIKMNSEEEIKKWVVESKDEGYSLKTAGETLTIAKPLTYLELSRPIDGIDLMEFPMIELEYKAKERNLQNIELVLGLDFDGDGVGDKSVFLDYPPTPKDWGKFEIDAYNLVKNSYPDEKEYNLVQIELRLKGLTKLKEREPSYLKRLRIYSRSLVSPVDFVFHKPVIELDGEKYWFKSKFKDKTDAEKLWFEQIVHLERGEHQLSMLEGDNFEVEWVIVEPETRNQKPETRQKPEIVFKKVNPTKYEVKVEGAKEPFWLVFSESFHKQWQLYPQQTQYAIRNTQYDTVADYPKLGVKEGKHTMRFTPGDIKYLFRKPLAAEHHLVNGYANGWYIDTEELGLPENFTLVLYFFPQSLFYIGLMISGFTFVGCMVYLGWGWRRRKRQ